VIASERHRILALIVLVAGCAPEGPPRPDGKAPFPMPNAASSGLPNPQDYETKGNLVVDRVTGLWWQQTVDTGPGEFGGFVWQDAVDHCRDLEVDGYDDFRLPTRLELVTIVDPSRTDPAIDSDAFPDTPSEAFWTASPVATDPEQVFHLNFLFGDTSTNSRVNEQAVRCVRTGQRPELPSGPQRFLLEGGIVVDRMTGLRWERMPSYLPPSADEEITGQESAARYCDDLFVDDISGFRLPSMNELQTLVDESRTDRAIDPIVFPGASGDGYWASTFVSDDPESAWLVRFSDGYSLYAEIVTPNLARCVR
jgi:hypothetical protein